MTTAPAPSPPENARPAWAQAAYERQFAMLGELAEAGMEVVTLIQREARAANADEARPSPETLRAIALFPRVARAVRQTLMLQDRVIRRLLGEEPKGGKQGKPDDPLHEPIAVIRRTVHTPAGPDYQPPETLDRLTWYGRERMERLEREGLEAGLSPDRIIALICEDLGLNPDWPRRAQEAWARGETASTLRGWPFDGLKCDRPDDQAGDPPHAQSP